MYYYISLLEYPHTRARIGFSIMAKLREYNIAKIIIPLTLDNAIANNVTTDCLRSVLPLTPTSSLIFHNRCVSHLKSRSSRWLESY